MALPHLGIDAIKVKVDTGARTSALQAFGVATYDDGGRIRVRFDVCPQQHLEDVRITCDLPLKEWRWVKDSGGHATYRPIIETPIRLGGAEHVIEISLARRADMGFRMLLGREALRGRYVVDPAASYLNGRLLP